jgi:hypothetical protein
MSTPQDPRPRSSRHWVAVWSLVAVLLVGVAIFSLWSAVPVQSLGWGLLAALAVILGWIGRAPREAVEGSDD